MTSVHETTHEPSRDVEKVDSNIRSADKVCRDISAIRIDKVAERSYGILCNWPLISWVLSWV